MTSTNMHLYLHERVEVSSQLLDAAGEPIASLRIEGDASTFVLFVQDPIELEMIAEEIGDVASKLRQAIARDQDEVAA